MTATTGTDRYTIISADTHAGANHETYREYLDPAFHEDFDAWRGKYKNPWKDLRDTDLRVRNWDDERRDADQLSDGVVGEVIFPNTVPPFYPGFVLFAGPPKPEDYAHRRAGIHAHNRWLDDFCDRKPAQRAGIGQIFLNDIDDAIADATWIKENGLRGGVLLPNVAPDVKWVKPLYHPDYDRLWAALAGPRHPGEPALRHRLARLRPVPVGADDHDQRGRLLRDAAARAHAAVGRVRAVPPAQVRDHRGLGLGVPPAARRSSTTSSRTSAAGRDRRAQVHRRERPAPLGHRVLPPELLGGRQLPRHGRRRGPPRHRGRPVHVGQRLPPRRGHPAVHAGSTCARSSTPSASRRCARSSAGNAAKLYDFDLDALAPLAAEHGPTVEEISQPLDRLPENPNRALLRGAAGAAA